MIDPSALFQAFAPSLAAQFLSGGDKPAQVGPTDDQLNAQLGEPYMDTLYADMEPEGEGVDEFPVMIISGDMSDDDLYEDAYGDPEFGAVLANPAVGGPFANWRNRRKQKRAARGRSSNRDLTSATTEMSVSLAEVTKELNKQVRLNKKQGVAINRLHKRQKESEKRVIKNKYVRAVLAAAQSVPGSRAYLVQISTQNQAFLKSLADVCSVVLTKVGEINRPTQTEPTDFAESKANLDEWAVLLADQIDEVSARLDAICDAIEDAEVADKYEAYEEIALRNQLIELAAYTPSQLDDRNAALLEAGIKFVMARVPREGATGNFSFAF